MIVHFSWPSILQHTGFYCLLLSWKWVAANWATFISWVWALQTEIRVFRALHAVMSATRSCTNALAVDARRRRRSNWIGSSSSVENPWKLNVTQFSLTEMLCWKKAFELQSNDVMLPIRLNQFSASEIGHPVEWINMKTRPAAPRSVHI